MSQDDGASSWARIVGVFPEEGLYLSIPTIMVLATREPVFARATTYRASGHRSPGSRSHSLLESLSRRAHISAMSLGGVNTSRSCAFEGEPVGDAGFWRRRYCRTAPHNLYLLGERGHGAGRLERAASPYRR